MQRQNELNWDEKPSKQQYIIVIAIIIILLLAIFAGLYYIVIGRKDAGVYEPNAINSEITVETSAVQDEAAAEDPQSAQNQTTTELGVKTDITRILTAEGAAETSEITLGIDVSRYQGNIDWEQVAAAGIDFAMIRVGYRTMESGEITEDSSAKYNLQEATANGIKVGVYFYSTAITEEEALEEANWTADFIAQYKITYPVVFDCEGYENPKSRQYHLTKEARTNLAKTFMNQIHEREYTPMFYASKGELEADNKWLTSELEKSYKIWISWYPASAYPDTAAADYSGAHDMWQYTNNGTVPGIDYAVDINVAYFGYENEADAKSDSAPEQVEADVEAGHTFTEITETVTAKEATNLRNIPSQGDDSTVMLTLYNGQTATRTGTSTSGWSRILYNGETYYAVSSLLTTDLTVKIPEPVPEENIQKPDDGIQTVFTERNEPVSPKIEVNLRNIPSVTSEESKVVVTAQYGEVFTRTGINEELGWSRVEYNGQTLYCVSSYIYVYETPAE